MWSVCVCVGGGVKVRVRHELVMGDKVLVWLSTQWMVVSESSSKDKLVYLFSYPDVIREKGLEHVTVEDLVTEVTPKGRGKAHMLHRALCIIIIIIIIITLLLPHFDRITLMFTFPWSLSCSPGSSCSLLSRLQLSYRTVWRKSCCRESELFWLNTRLCERDDWTFFFTHCKSTSPTGCCHCEHCWGVVFILYRVFSYWF